MERYKGYRIAIFILATVVIIEAILLARLWGTRVRKIPKAPEAPIAIKGTIAIVIDDWGYNTNNVHSLSQIPYPLTASILPHLVYSKIIAQELHTQGREIILHLPMEPYEKFRLEKETITNSMDASTIRGIVSRDLSDSIYAKGVSNHMGSKATGDERVMRILFEELKNRHLYFLDSLVSPKSICFNLAGKMRVSFARRDVFLDNKEEAEYIKSQIAKLKNKANLYGHAIGIGHDRKITLDVLKEMMPVLEKEGYVFVFVSELVR